MDGWYVGINGQQRGPLTLDEVTAAARSAGPSQTYVWREGFAEWKFAADVPEIAARLGAVAAARPAPPSMETAPQGAGATYSGRGNDQTGRGVSFTDAIASGFRKYATFSGRAPRSEFWFWVLFNFLASIAASIVDLVLGGFGIVNLLVALGLLLPNLAVTARRFHDLDRTAWWLLALYLLPIPVLSVPLVLGDMTVIAFSGIAALALGILFLVWLCTRGTKGPNRFGEDPLGG